MVVNVPGGDLGAQRPASAEPGRAVRLLAGVSSDLGMTIEGDFARWNGLSLIGSLQRWSFGDGYACAGRVVDEAAVLSGPGRRSAICSPDGWAFGVGLRAIPDPQGTVSAFVQAELGLHLFDDDGTLGPLVAGRGGLVVTAGGGASVEGGLAIQYMAGSGPVGGGRERGSWLVGTWQLGFGIPIS